MTQEERLDNLVDKLEREFGTRRCGCFIREGETLIQVADEFEEDAERMIKEAGFKYKDKHWFGGTAYDGLVFILDLDEGE